MAEGFAKVLGGALFEAHSAGSKPSGKVNDRAIQFMREVNIDLISHQSKSLASFDSSIQWDYVVTMGCGDACPAVSGRQRLDWQIEDPKNLTDDQFREIRDEIKDRIQRLIHAINKDLS